MSLGAVVNAKNVLKWKVILQLIKQNITNKALFGESNVSDLKHIPSGKNCKQQPYKRS